MEDRIDCGGRERKVPRTTRASPPALWGLGRPASLNQRLPESIQIDQDPKEHWAPPPRKP